MKLCGFGVAFIQTKAWPRLFALGLFSALPARQLNGKGDGTDFALALSNKQA
ncbi:hypothetical protein ACFDR9_001084 [Janthinobacterium sp. CG_23.3]|uniref:hypothetical protein n=1 Tax=Janthinobacterium sp. CG_23.3 TaxID=3349634 RepID=UPI0038D4AC32